MIVRICALVLVAGCLLAVPGAGLAAGGDRSTPGEILIEPSTPSAVAVRWPVHGDANGNASIAVQWRAAGEGAWRAGWPLFRTHPSKVSPENRVADGVLFAGSVVDLAPGTDYELRLALADPDGGDTERTLRVRTAAEPALPAGLRNRWVVPYGTGSGAGTQADPFRGLAAALARAEPGDRLLLAPGEYDAGGTVIGRSGRTGHPIVIAGPAAGAAVLDGGGKPVLLDASGREHIWIERLTLRNADTLLRADKASHLVVRRNRFEFTTNGMIAAGAVYTESTGIHVIDNVFEGPATWPRSRGNEPVVAVGVTGAGHVVAWNRFHATADAIHNGEFGRISASDYHNNDIELATDDGIEADYADTNVRVFRNRIVNAFAGISGQPVHGGPVYVYRNFIVNTQYSPFKLHNHVSGMLLFHNTSLKSRIAFVIDPAKESVNDVVTRNNLFIGTRGTALYIRATLNRCDFDADGYDIASGVFATWNGRQIRDARELAGEGGLYGGRGAIMLGPRRTLKTMWPPERFEAPVDPATADPALAERSAAIDAGVVLENFSDGYAGAAPDLGCCEAGAPPVHYGPRPEPAAP
ncbi:MAG: hypothetical protein AB7Q97_23385 [Gammaproteobacteria bacterium]